MSTTVRESGGDDRNRDAGGRSGTWRGSTGGPRGGGIDTSRYNYDIFSNTFYDFVSVSIWAPDPLYLVFVLRSSSDH